MPRAFKQNLKTRQKMKQPPLGSRRDEGRPEKKSTKEKRQHGGNKSPPIDAAPTRLRHKCGRGRDIQKETPPYQGWYEIQRARCRARCREQSWVSRLQGRWFATAHYVGYVIGVEHAWQLIRISIRAWSEPGDIFDAPYWSLLVEDTATDYQK